ncbi:MAG: hypothetical protein N4A40_13355 [Tissierellales bacterium]|jgi:hypothetical protein|nr:hypothetical protein [Tissierellales bacterium]
MKNKEIFNSLPEDVRADIKRVLGAYDECNVVYEDGVYNVSPSTALRSNYSSDRKSYGTFYKKDVLTPEEQELKYIENFHSYPSNYKGKRNYKFLKELSDLRSQGITAFIKKEDGDYKISHTVNTSDLV